MLLKLQAIEMLSKEKKGKGQAKATIPLEGKKSK
jgi:hypothetical protein